MATTKTGDKMGRLIRDIVYGTQSVLLDESARKRAEWESCDLC